MKFSTSPRKFGGALSRNAQGTANDSSHHEFARVAELAYFLYEQRGRQDGHDVEDWLQAEQTVLAAQNHVATIKKASLGGVASEERAAQEKTKRG